MQKVVDWAADHTGVLIQPVTIRFDAFKVIIRSVFGDFYGVSTLKGGLIHELVDLLV